MILTCRRPDGEIYMKRRCGGIPREIALLMARKDVDKVTITHADGYTTEYSKR